jgi:hypothetical protein
LNDTALIVPLELGERTSLGEDDGRERSYMDMTLDEAAKVGRERWWLMLVKPDEPKYVAEGAELEGVSYGE